MCGTCVPRCCCVGAGFLRMCTGPGSGLNLVSGLWRQWPGLPPALCSLAWAQGSVMDASTRSFLCILRIRSWEHNSILGS